MKRYIRTKNNKIYETCTQLYDFKYLVKHGGDLLIDKENIIIESDSIFDLIQVGDLVNFGKNYIQQIRNEYTLECSYLCDDVIEIYTKQNDNYILVWDKERGVRL